LDSVFDATTPETLDAVVINFESGDARFSQQCDLIRNIDGSIVWKNHPTVRKEQFTLLETDVKPQNLATLRHQRALAAAFPKEREAAQQYAASNASLENDLRKERSLRQLLRTIGATTLLLDEAEELRSRLIGIHNAIKLQPDVYPAIPYPFDPKLFWDLSQ